MHTLGHFSKYLILCEIILGEQLLDVFLTNVQMTKIDNKINNPNVSGYLFSIFILQFYFL